MDTLLPMRQDGPIFLYNKDAFTTFLRGPVTKRTASEQYDPDGEQEGKRSLRYKQIRKNPNQSLTSEGIKICFELLY